MATGKRNLRQVLDAHYDISYDPYTQQGLQLPDASTFTGWTTQIPNYLSYLNTPYQQYLWYTYFSKDGSGNYPYQDAVVVDNTAQTATWSTLHIVNVGMKHYHQQMQCMTPHLADNFNSSSPSTSITQVGNGSGTFKNNNISLGDMRGFQYAHTGHIIWPSTQTTEEYLYNTGEISIGSTS